MLALITGEMLDDMSNPGKYHRDNLAQGFTTYTQSTRQVIEPGP